MPPPPLRADDASISTCDAYEKRVPKATALQTTSFQLLCSLVLTETHRMHIYNPLTEHTLAAEWWLDHIGRHAKSGAKEGVLPQLCQNLLQVAGETTLYREASRNCRLVVRFFPTCTTPSQMHQFQWFLAYEKPVTNTSAR